jgi:tetratricopeptide (TPR) repeat protein
MIPITTRQEWWINDELHVRALEIFNDSQHGERTFELVSIKRGEPDTERFHLPSGYTVHEVNAPGIVPDSTPHADEALDLAHAPAVSREEAIAMLASQDRQRQLAGAAVLVKGAQAGEDPAVKDDVAYRLARASIGLAEAHSLANFAVTSAEHDCAGQSAPLTQRSQFTSQIALARYWDTLGYIYDRQGDSDTARSYIESAWKLDPLAYYGSHLGRILGQAGDTEEAVAVYRASLQAPGSEQLKGTIRERLNALAGDSEKTPGTAEEELPGTGNLAGSAFFDIVYFSSTKSPTAAFVNGDEPLRALVPALARQEGASFTLPDTGPERAMRRVEVTCSAQAGSSSACRIRVLGAHEARDLLGQN